MTTSPSCRTDDSAEIVAALLARYPLPPSWTKPELFTDVTAIVGVSVHAVGVCSEHASGDCVTGSAAGLGAPDASRAYFELLERAAVMDAIRRGAQHDLRLQDGTWCGRASAAELFPPSPEPELWRYAKSNGVALGFHHVDACARAEWELIERDRILRSWRGQTRPLTLLDAIADAALPRELAEVYDFQACLFPPGDSEYAPERTAVGGVFGFPRQATAPLIFGFGARPSPSSALAAAGRECLQRLAFLWGEEIPDADPPFAPTAEVHQEYFLQPRRHATLQQWLSRGRYNRASASRQAPARSRSARRFADLTPAALRGTIAIIKALPETELPLCFGRAAWDGDFTSRTDFHPIP